MGGIYGERLTGVTNANVLAPGREPLTAEQRTEQARERVAAWQKAWSEGSSWNWSAPASKATCRKSRCGSTISSMTDFKDTANHAANGATDGMIAIQMHFTDETEPLGRWRLLALARDCSQRAAVVGGSGFGAQGSEARGSD